VLGVGTTFGLAAMLLHPLLFHLTAVGDWLSRGPPAIGLRSGTEFHKTAQVIASASQADGALEMATLARSVRIFMIGPVVLAFRWWFAAGLGRAERTQCAPCRGRGLRLSSSH